MKCTPSNSILLGRVETSSSEVLQLQIKHSFQGILNSALLIFMLSFSQIGFGQASVPTMTQEMVAHQVKSELDTWVQSENFQSIVANHPSAKGMLTLEISIYERGKVRSIFQVESTIDDVPFRNSVKNHIKEFKFDLKKMDKKTTQKVVYTFKID